MTGYLFGEAYQQLSYHSRAFVLPTAIDATRPVLLDQMGFGKCVIVRNTPVVSAPLDESMRQLSIAGVPR